MPVYQFKRRDNGKIITRLYRYVGVQPKVLTHANDPEHRLPVGVEADFAPFAASASRDTTRRHFPFASTSVATDPALIPEARQRLGCDFTRSGRAIFRSASHQASVLKAAGLVNIS